MRHLQVTIAAGGCWRDAVTLETATKDRDKLYQGSLLDLKTHGFMIPIDLVTAF